MESWRGRMWKSLEVAAGVLGLVVFHAAMGLGFHLVRVAPRVPVPQAGRVEPLLYHGVVVYLTARENTTRTLLFVGAAVLFAVAVVIEMAVKPFRSR